MLVRLGGHDGHLGPLGRHAGYREADLGAMGDHVAFLGRDLEAMPDLLGPTWVPCGASWGRLEGYEASWATARKPFARFWQAHVAEVPRLPTKRREPYG